MHHLYHLPLRRRSFRLLILSLLVGICAASIGYAGTRQIRGAATPVQRIVVTSPSETNPGVASIAAGLQRAGFARTSDPGALQSLVSAATRTVVFTPNGLQAASPAEIRSHYARGIVVATINVPLPQLESAVQPGGASSTLPLKASASQSSASGTWLPTSPSYIIFSLVRQTKTTHGVLVSRTSDILTSVDAFVNRLAHAEASDQIATLPSLPPILAPSPTP
jgi:hypothetical protein